MEVILKQDLQKRKVPYIGRKQMRRERNFKQKNRFVGISDSLKENK